MDRRRASEPARGGQRIEYAAGIASAESERGRIELTAEWILSVFDDFYDEFLRLTWAAKAAFETRDHPTAIANARRRLGLYNATVYPLADELRAAFPQLKERAPLWAEVEAAYRAAVHGRYEADLALAYLHSAQRRVHHGEWKPVEYGFGGSRPVVPPADAVYERFGCSWPLEPLVIQRALRVAQLAVPFCDPAGDAELIARRVNDVLAGRSGGGLRAIEMVRGGFFRNRGAYLVGRLVLRGTELKPFVIALLNGGDGVRAEAVLHAVPHVHNLCSSTEAPFQVTNRHYHELSAFLQGIMPRRPLGLHYSTIGYYHYSKVAVMNEVRRRLAHDRELLGVAPGSPGTVTIAFTSPHSDYILKVIRDQPTSDYKWDSFEGVDAVLAKYKRVHEINRTGSMLDNIVYYNLKLERSWFAPALAEELLQAAPNSVQLLDEALVFKYLIVQRKLTPLNVFIENAPEDKALRAMLNLGFCIRNNAAANVFNKDFDTRNYGVSRYLKIYLYDYDAVETLTDIKVRTNRDRCDGEEEVPAWFFEPGVVFLPEEIEAGLRVRNRALRRAFRAVHADLMSVEYWEGLQQALRAGEVPGIHTFPQSCQLQDFGAETIATE
ncbi:MAG TPA: isocitrate dehydrogenase kinase/phosphatase AceK regulatory subunit [Steroidobacteraceae bacterium]|jgi:isocitrate dehydrogenase kinase/phosphatase|nr:isocitrate dehydrogenase kinase/phosphatase AceK regulatory subunit [Steroidobacteraceae bacterium]